MIDQSFNIKALLEIFNLENRKGNDIEECFPTDFSRTIKIREEISKVNAEIKLEANPVLKKDLNIKKSKLKKQREETIISTLSEISTRIYKHSINLTQENVYGMICYIADYNIENLFISKKIQSNISEIYNVRQSSRFSILSQLITLIEDKFPKYIIRTDISSFYESIPQFPLLEKIRTDNLLSVKSIEFIEQIFLEYNILTGQSDPRLAKGVPRGVGISAYLVELYMKKIDSLIKNLDDLVFYARYVDDIILVFIPKETKKKANNNHYIGKVKAILKNQTSNFLTLNEDKTKEFDYITNKKSLFIPSVTRIGTKIVDKFEYKNSIQYLGYRIGFNGVEKDSQIIVALSENKIEKIKKRLKLSFDCFNTKCSHNSKEQFLILISRLNYLISNTRLLNNKSKVLIGSFYSNSFVINSDCFYRIQKYLDWYIARSKMDVNQKTKIKKMSFIDGFEKKKFHVLSVRDKKYNMVNAKKSDIINQGNEGLIKVGLIKIKQIW